MTPAITAIAVTLQAGGRARSLRVCSRRTSRRPAAVRGSIGVGGGGRPCRGRGGVVGAGVGTVLLADCLGADAVRVFGAVVVAAAQESESVDLGLRVGGESVLWGGVGGDRREAYSTTLVLPVHWQSQSYVAQFSSWNFMFLTHSSTTL